MSIRDRDFRDAPERAAAHLAATRLFHEQRADMYRRYLDERPTWSAEWNAAAPDSESLLRLTSAELDELARGVARASRKYDEKGRAAEARGRHRGARERRAAHVRLPVPRLRGRSACDRHARAPGPTPSTTGRPTATATSCAGSAPTPSSMIGDSVYYIALSWAAVQAGTATRRPVS